MSPKSRGNSHSILSRFRQNLWVEGLQIWTCLWMILGPVPAGRSSWSDTDANSSNDTWTDPVTLVATSLADMNLASLDADGDGAANDEEAAEGSDPYKFDTDFDGLSDGDELHLARVSIPGLSLTNWDSDGDFVSDYDEYRSCNWVVYAGGVLPSFPNASYWDYDGDTFPNPDDPAYNDPTNLSGINAIAWAAEALADADHDGVVNFHDPDPYSTNDADEDGLPDVQDPFPDDPINYSALNNIAWGGAVLGDADGDSVLNHLDVTPYPASEDSDGDSISNDIDPFPLDATNYSAVNSQAWGADWNQDLDGDLIQNWKDPAPYSELNTFHGIDWRGEVLDDADNDGVLNWLDPSPMPLEVDEDGDGLTQGEELFYGTSDQDADSDDDGLTDKAELMVYHTDPSDAHSLSTLQGWGTLYLDFDLVDQVDGDSDGIPRRIEQLYGLDDTVAADAQGDLDANNVSNLAQYLNGVALDAGLALYDHDRDEMSDVFENQYQLDRDDPTDAVGDPDGDGVMNYEEARWALNPHLPDTHGLGGLGDLQYLMTKVLYPNGNAPVVDSDMDGIPDWAEQALTGTTPWFTRAAPGDLDGDGLRDSWEHRYGRGRYPLNGLNPRVAEAAGDPDSDGLTNLIEQVHGLHPLIADSSGGTLQTGPQFTEQPPEVVPVAPGSSAPPVSWAGNSSGNNPGTGGVVAAAPPALPAGSPVDHTLSATVLPSGYNGDGEKFRYQVRTGSLWHYEYTDYLVGYSEPIHGSFWDLVRSGMLSTYSTELELGEWSTSVIQAYTERYAAGPPELYDVEDGTYLGTRTTHQHWRQSGTEFRNRIIQPASRWWRYYYNKVRLTTVNRQVQPVEHLGKVCLIIEPGNETSQVISLYAKSPEHMDEGTREEILLETIDGSGDPQPGYRISASDAAGPAYRKIGLNGMPLSDSKPQSKDESGELPEETYVDAFTRQLSHGVTDVYSPVDSSLLQLAVRRNAREHTWSQRSGLRPSEFPDAPFGPGWSSNLCANIRFEDDYRKAVVTDEQGAQAVFFRSLPTSTSPIQAAHVWVHSREEKQDARTAYDTLETVKGANGAPTRFIYRKKYGTVCTYAMAPLTQSFSTNRMEGSYKTTRLAYARLTGVEDRWNNELLYTYPSSTTLIPSKIHDPSRPGQVIWIRQNEGVVSAVRGPGGQTVTYDYATRNSGVHQARCLTSVTRGGSKVGYDYLTVTENPPAGDVDPDGPLDTSFTHVVLDRITDEKGGQYRFEYEFNHGNKSFEVSGSDFKLRSQLGLPQMITKVTQPHGAVVNFSGIRNIRTNQDATLAHAGVQTQVSGACGTYVYTFSQPDVFVPLANDPGREDDPYSKQLTVFFSRLTVGSPAGNEVYDFDFDHGMALTSATDLSGNTTTFHYGAVGSSGLGWNDPVKQVNALGKSRHFTYDNDTRVMKSMTDERGTMTSYVIQPGTGLRTRETVSKGGSTLRVTDYDYGNGGFTGFLSRTTLTGSSATGGDMVTEYAADANGRVKKETVTAGGGIELVTSYTYTGNGSKKTVTNPRGHTTTFIYDPLSLRLEKVENPDGTVRTLAYDAHGNLVKEINERGVQVTHAYDGIHRRTRTLVDMDVGPDLVSSTTYNAFNLPATQTDARGVVTSHTYDNIGRRLTTTVGNGADAQTTTYVYGANSGGSLFDVSGFKPTTVTDARGHVTTNTYDNLYRLTGQTGPEGHFLTNTYDDAGNLEEVKDALNRITKTTFDGLNRPTKVEYPDATTRHSYYNPAGQVWKVVDELGRETFTQYDRAGRAIEVTLPAVNGVSPVTRTAYDACGNVVAVQNPLGHVSTTTYDSRNRPTKEISPYVWDAVAGDWARPEVTTTYDEVGNVVSVTDPLGAVTTSAYDNANRRVRATGAMGHVTEQDFDANGNVVRTRDALKRETHNTYDDFNRLVETEDAEGQVTLFGYDKNGNRTSVTDPRGKETMFTYDGLNRLKKETFQEGVWTERHYDAIRETTREDSAGREFTFGYDLRDRLTTTTWEVAGSPVVRTRVYDTAGRLTDVTETGRPEATVGYTYDALNRVATETSQGLTHTYTYDLAGRRTQSALGTGRTISLTYDGLGRQLAISEGVRNTSYYYDLASRVAAIHQANGGWQCNGYDVLGRLNYRELTTASDVLVGQMLWTHDAVGNVTSQSHRWPGFQTGNGWWHTTGMAYDQVNRLVGETRAKTTTRVGAIGYAYDAGGNRVLELSLANPRSTVLYAFNDFNQLTGWTKQDDTGAVTQTVTLTYDTAGNRSSKVVSTATQAPRQTTYHWDAENRLEGVTLYNGVEHEYAYDYRMRRVSRLENGVGSAVVYSGGLSVAEYATQTTAPTVEYLRGPDMGGGVGGMLYSLRNAGSDVKYTLSSSRGDVMAQSGANGQLTWSSGYTGFGSRHSTGGTNLDRQRANTKEEDPTGLLNEGFRYRDIETGVWLSRDPAGFVDGPNLYTYVRQNPWTSFDPEGLFLKDRLPAWAQFAVDRVPHLNDLDRAVDTGLLAGLVTAQDGWKNGLMLAVGDQLGTKDFAESLEGHSVELRGSIFDGNLEVNAREMGATERTIKGTSGLANMTLTVLGVRASVRPKLPAHVTPPKLPAPTTTAAEVAEGVAEAAVESAPGNIKFQRWKRGEAIDKPMPDGSNPSWDVVRSRYWKNRYKASKGTREFDTENMARMRRGSAPQDYNRRTGQWESRELHHVDPQRNQGSNGPFNLREVTPDQHRAIDSYRK